METNLYTITIPPMIQTLGALSHIIDKAEHHVAEKAADKYAAALLNERLIFNQFSFLKQVQIATDNAKGGAARIAGIEAPKFEDTETTFDELRGRIKKTLDFLATITLEMLVGREESRVTLPHRPGLDLSAFEYATLYLMPNFYFHATSAYAIMRKNGVDIGKSDYLKDLPWRTIE